MLRSDLCDNSDAHIVVKGTIIVNKPDNGKRNKAVEFITMYHLSTAFQRLMVYKLTMQKI